MHYNVGDTVYFFTMYDRIAGVINKVYEKNGEYYYDIQYDMHISKMVRESHVLKRTIVEPPKFAYGDVVKFNQVNKQFIGTIAIIDAYGTMEQSEEPSYDIYVKENNCLYKHIRESDIICKEEVDV